MMKSSRTWISIHAPREGGDQARPPVAPGTRISIHAPREGGDRTNYHPHDENCKISIHAPREGGDSKDAQFYL